MRVIKKRREVSQVARLAKVDNPIACALAGYLAHKKCPPPYAHHRDLGMRLLKGPREKRFLMSEVPL